MMAADPKPDDQPDPKPDDTPKPDVKPDPDPDAKRDVPPEVKAALHKANKEAETLRLKLKEYEDRDKSESEKAADARAAAEKERDEAVHRSLRLEVAFEKGLTPAQAKRLAGSTREELEADADDLIEMFGQSGDGKKPPTSRPKERLRGGGDPDDEPEESDPAKLAAKVNVRY